METDVKKMSVEQLKALAFDCIVQRDLITNNLNVLNEELRQRAGQVAEAKETEKKK